MKHYLIGKVQGNIVLAVLWDRKSGTASVRIAGPTRIDLTLDNLSIVYGIDGEGDIHFAGRMFSVSKVYHEELTERFPDLDLEEQYLLADDWCCRKSRKIKSPLMFMNNWLKKAKGGNVHSGNLVY